MAKNLFDKTPFLEPFVITEKVENFISDYGLKDQIKIIGYDDDEFEMKAQLTHATAEKLARTSHLFKSYKPAEENLEGNEKAITEMILKMAKKIKSRFKPKVEVVMREGAFGNNYYWYRVTISAYGEEEEVDILSYRAESGLNLAEGASSWDWAAWLGIPDSPFYDSDFVDAYDYTDMTLAMGEMMATFNESGDKFAIEDALQRLADLKA